MQTAGDFVGILVEFSARMKLRHDDFSRRHAFFGMNVSWNATTIVGDGARAIGIQRDGDERRMSGQSFVNRIIDDFIDHVVQARAVIRIADIHAGALTHGVKTTQDLDGIGAVNRLFRRCNRISHGASNSSIFGAMAIWKTRKNSASGCPFETGDS